MEENEIKEERKNKRLYYGIITIALIIILSIGATFAWFTSQANKNIEVVTTGTLQIRYTQGSYIDASNLKPATTTQVLEAYTDGSCVYSGDREAGITTEHICAYNTFTITNIGTLNASNVNIYLTDVTNTYDNYLNYMLFETTPSELVGTNLIGTTYLKTNESISATTNNSKTYTLLIWLDENSGIENQGNTYNAKIKASTEQSNIAKFYYKDTSNANAPVLAEGMIPIMYDGTNWVKADYYDSTSEYAGYDYGNQKWANAVMVTSSTRDTYMSADIGTTVAESDILAYYVWIPRYKYKLFNATYASGTSSQLIDVVFESGTSTTGTVTCSYSANGAETCTNKANGNYYTHPAFTFGDTELSGIWVGKFETTGSETTPTIKPGITSLTDITVSSMYNTSKVFNTTTYLTADGIQNTDSHMMKNIEWGAVAYLKQSIYGLGITDIGINNNSSYKTGCGAASGSSSSSTCNTYNTTNGMLASTTGNITGVYDMSGGAYEHVMGNYNKTAGDSGLTVSNVPSKYIDIYAGDSVSYSHLGDATGETAGWYSDYDGFVYSSDPWFNRGGFYDYGSSAGVFSFLSSFGTSYTRNGFRVFLATTGA